VKLRAVAAATLLAAVLANGIVTGGAAASAVPGDRTASPALVGFGVATVAPSRGLVDGQVVQVTASGFGAASTLYALECTRKAIQATNHGRWCDRTAADVVSTPATNGAATFAFAIRTGGHFHAAASGAACGYNHDDSKCDIVVADTLTLAKAQYVAYPTITFKDPRIVTSTAVTPARRTVSTGAVVTLTARTTHAPGAATMTGTVVFADNGTVFASVAERATGKVTAKLRTPRVGKQRITVSYSGDRSYRPSVGRSTIVVKA
jgi:Bacterial Ig-like domain (group 3)/Neocarzinostatin family